MSIQSWYCGGLESRWIAISWSTHITPACKSFLSNWGFLHERNKWSRSEISTGFNQLYLTRGGKKHHMRLTVKISFVHQFLNDITGKNRAWKVQSWKARKWWVTLTQYCSTVTRGMLAEIRERRTFDRDNNLPHFPFSLRALAYKEESIFTEYCTI